MPQDDWKFTAPTDLPETVKAIILKPMLVDGIYGLGCSPDNGVTNRVYWTIYGRKYYQEDGDRIWPFLIDKVRSVLSLDWDDIQDKPVLVTKEELDQRLAKLNIPTTMSWDQITGKPDLALKQDIPKVTEFVKGSELVDYAKKSELPSTDGLAKQTDLEQVQNDVTKVQQTADHAVELVKSAKTTIDTSSVNVNKQPSDYPNGFSYELKSLNVLGIDRSQAHSSAQSGNLGLLTTKTVSYNGTKYVRQVLEQLDNARPLNYVRNGMNNNWSAWEASTNW